MIKNVQFNTDMNKFQSKLNEDINQIKTSPDMIISADKSLNKYLIPVDDYKKAVKDNITSLYKKTVTK